MACHKTATSRQSSTSSAPIATRIYTADSSPSAPMAASARVATPCRDGSRRHTRWQTTPVQNIHWLRRMPKWSAPSATNRRGPKTKYRMAFARCLDCHEDEHKGQFEAGAVVEPMR